MAELPPLTERELRFVRELVNQQVRFLIVGLSAAALQGAPVVTQVARILVSKKAADRPKDRLVVPVLEEVVAIQAARSGQQG